MATRSPYRSKKFATPDMDFIRAVEADSYFVPVDLVEASTAPAPERHTCRTAAGAVKAPPTDNMGEPDKAAWPVLDYRAIRRRDDLSEVKLFINNRKTLTMLQRVKGADDSPVIIDWVNFTISEKTIFRCISSSSEYQDRRFFGSGLIDEDFVRVMSRELEKILGFGVTAKRKTGANFYSDSWVLGEDFGLICFGGRNDTMMVSLSGAGCTKAVPGWEGRLFEWLTEARSHGERAVITRVDLARDYFDGEYSIEWFEGQYDAGGFVNCERHLEYRDYWPSRERRGDWETKRGCEKGRTMYVGSRLSGLFFRVYEKGRKEGCKESPWTRAELELKSVDRIIPLDVLVRPGAFFGQYPVLRGLCPVQPQHVEIVQKSGEITFEKMQRVIKEQYGKHLRVVHSMLGEEGLLALMDEDVNAMPRRLAVWAASIESSPPFLHRQSRELQAAPINCGGEFQRFAVQ